jgi:hypothetical protein
MAPSLQQILLQIRLGPQEVSDCDSGAVNHNYGLLWGGGKLVGEEEPNDSRCDNADKPFHLPATVCRISADFQNLVQLL